MLTVSLTPAAAIADDTSIETRSDKPLLEQFDKGHINWKSGEYIANVSAPVPSQYRGKTVNQAMGKELAKRVSRTLADSVFLQIVADTRVDANHRLSELVKTDTEIKLAGNIKGKELIESRWVNKDNKLWLEASYRISMRGVNGVISHIYNQVIEARPATSPPVSPVSKPTKTAEDTQAVVYIDARGTGLQPALFPSILDEQHGRLFNPAAVGKAYIANNGVVEYVIADANKPLSELIGNEHATIISAHPVDSVYLESLINSALANDPAPVRKRKKRRAMKATQAEGLLKSNIIVGTDDAERLRKAQSEGELGGHPKIIVITDGTIGGTEGKLDNYDSLWALQSF